MPVPHPTVSVIIATFNKSAALRYAIKSVLWQTYTDFEVHIIGDCCTDDSEEIVRSFNDPRLSWYNLDQNAGYQSEPNNEGLRRARGTYVSYLNHDDVWLPNHLEALIGTIKEKDLDFVCSILERVYTDERPNADVPSFPDFSNPPEASAVVHRRDIVDEIGYWRPSFETYSVPRAEFFRRFQHYGKRMELVPLLTVIKFGWHSGEYSDESSQEMYMRRIVEDSNFVHKELATLLSHAYGQLEFPLSIHNVIHHLSNWVRSHLIRRQIDPQRIYFWRKRGWKIRKWRRMRGVEN